MSWWVAANTRGAQRSRSRIAKGAVPIGQHSHSPQHVLGTTPAVVRVTPLAPTGPRIHRRDPDRDAVYPNLAEPAPRASACRCGQPAALVQPTTGEAFCAAHWMSEIVLGQLE